MKKQIDMDNNIYTDFVANCKKQSKKVGDVLNIILKKYNNEKNRKWDGDKINNMNDI